MCINNLQYSLVGNLGKALSEFSLPLRQCSALSK